MFYKYENQQLLFGEVISLPDGVTLNVNYLSEVELPYQDWYYFETEQEAKDFFGITE